MQCNALVVVLPSLSVANIHKHTAYSLCFALTLVGCKRRNGQTDTMSAFVLPVFIYFEMRDTVQYFLCMRKKRIICHSGGAAGVNKLLY